MLPTDKSMKRGKRFALAALAISVLVVAYVHYQLLRAAPDPELFPDSEGYLAPVLESIFHGRFALTSIRTPGYSLFLLTILNVFRWLPAVTIFQHALLILTGCITALISYRFIRPSYLLAIFIGTLTALLPRPLASAQQLLTETLYSFIEVCLVFSIATASKSAAANRTWVAAGILSVLAAFVRPIGTGLLVAIPAGILTTRMGKRTIRALTLWVVPVMFLSLSWCAVNLKHFGFWGFTQFGSYALFVNNAYLLEPGQGSAQISALRTTLRPGTPGAAVGSREADWMTYSGEDYLAIIDRSGCPPAQRERILRDLAVKAIAGHPFKFLRDQVVHFIWFILESGKRPPGRLSILYNSEESLKRYMGFSSAHPEIDQMLQISRESPGRYLARAEQLSSYPYEKRGYLAHVLWPLTWVEEYLPVAAFCLGLLAVWKNRSPLAIYLLFIATVHILLTNLGGSRSGRHGVPLEPIYLLMIMAAAQRDNDQRLQTRFRPAAKTNKYPASCLPEKPPVMGG